VKAHKAERHARGFGCWSQFVAMMFCHLGQAKSLREICNGLMAIEGKLKHLGIDRPPNKSTLSYANEHRPWQLYQTVFGQLLSRCEGLAKGKKKFRFQNKLLTMDSTNIELCATLFDWARYKRAKGAAKVHLILDNEGHLPHFAVITDGKKSDQAVARMLHFEPGTILVIDRGYVDYKWWQRLTDTGVYFVTRFKKDILYEVIEDRKTPKTGGIVRDQVIRLVGDRGSKCSMRLRLITKWDEEKQEIIQFLTNHLKFGATTIARIYKERWQIGVSSQGHIVQSVRDRPRLRDSSLVAWEAPWRESKTAEPSDNILRKECAQRTRLQRAVNADVASLHESPVAETVYNARKQQELAETSPTRQLSPAGYQRRHGVKDDVETGETLGARRRNLVEEMPAITSNGKCWHRHQGGGSGRSTEDGRAAKRARREGPGPVGIPSVKVRQG
jgi:hypothetical protein